MANFNKQPGCNDLSLQIFVEMIQDAAANRIGCTLADHFRAWLSGFINFCRVIHYDTLLNIHA